MLVKDVMTTNISYVEKGMSLQDAARRMKELGCGFLPVSDEENEKLIGVVTDRDIAIRAVADSKDPATTPVEEIASDRVLYCYEGDNIEDVAKNMGEQQIWRLIVLDNPGDKNFCGILSAGDFSRHDQHNSASVVAQQAHAA